MRVGLFPLGGTTSFHVPQEGKRERTVKPGRTAVPDGGTRWEGPIMVQSLGLRSSAQACPSLCPNFRSGFPVRTGKRKANLPLPSPLGCPADEHSGVDEGAEGTCLSSPLLMK